CSSGKAGASGAAVSAGTEPAGVCCSRRLPSQGSSKGFSSACRPMGNINARDRVAGKCRFFMSAPLADLYVVVGHFAGAGGQLAVAIDRLRVQIHPLPLGRRPQRQTEGVEELGTTLDLQGEVGAVADDRIGLDGTGCGAPGPRVFDGQLAGFAI